MFSWIILIVAIAIFCLLGFLLFSKIFGRGEPLPPLEQSEDVIAANQRAVAEGNIGDIQLEVVHRGYRMDQVDALLAQLGEKYGFAPTTGQILESSVISEAPVVEVEGETTYGSNEASHR